MIKVVVVGGGIAGISAAYEIAGRHTVTLLEQEPQLAFHTTGRSAALFTENYGDGTVRPLTAASRAFFDAPPPRFANHPLLSDRGTLTIAHENQRSAAQKLFEAGRSRSPKVELINTAAALRRCPVLRADRVALAVWDPDAADIDVAALHQGYVRGLRARGGTITAASGLTEAVHTEAGWSIRAAKGTVRADIIVNAAGAWGDEVARRCGIDPVGLAPRRRTAFMVAAPAHASRWPMIIDADEQFYFKPDGTQLLCSPADETPSQPVDARPEEIDVAIAIDRINEATTLGIRHVRSQWAGLRTFAPDNAMVIGRDITQAAFVWAVGQGGTGIQSAPAAARLVASAVDDAEVPPDLVVADLDVNGISPARFS